MRITDLAAVMRADDVGMLELPDRAHFVLETGDRQLVHKFNRQYLQRHDLI